MPIFKPGDVIALPYFPNEENKNEGTARLVLIVEVFNDSYLIVPFTKQTHQSANYTKCIEILKESALGKNMGLLFDSILVLDRQLKINKIIAKPPILGNCGEDFLIEHF
jgi:hypothetical protein